MPSSLYTESSLSHNDRTSNNIVVLLTDFDRSDLYEVEKEPCVTQVTPKG